MDITAESVANILVFIVPGYFASRVYAAIYAKPDKDFSRVLVESVVFSLPIVAVYTQLWRSVTGNDPRAFTSIKFVLPLLAFAIAVGLLAAYIRTRSSVKGFAKRIRLPDADEDFIRRQFDKLEEESPVTVTLKNSEVFSGTPKGGSSYRVGYSRQYYFSNVAWYNKARNTWEERPGSIIVDMNEVQYIETNELLYPD